MTDQHLTLQERRIAAVLLYYKPEIVSYSRVASFAWPEETGNGESQERRIRVVLTRLRKKAGKGAFETHFQIGISITDLAPDWVAVQARAEMITMQIASGGLDAELDPKMTASLLVPSHYSRKGKTGRPPTGAKSPGPRRPKEDQRGWPCLKKRGGCYCQCHKITAGVRARIAEKGHQQDKTKRVWTPAQDRFLQTAWEKTHWLPTVHEQYTETYTAYPRSIYAVRHRLVYLGHSLRDGQLTPIEIGRELGVSSYTVYSWIKNASIKARRHWSSHWWIVMQEDFEEFLQTTDVPLEIGKIRSDKYRFTYMNRVRETLLQYGRAGKGE